MGRSATASINVSSSSYCIKMERLVIVLYMTNPCLILYSSTVAVFVNAKNVFGPIIYTKAILLYKMVGVMT